MSAYITSIGTANPTYKINQQQVLDFMINAHELDDEEAKKLAILYRATGIHYRYTTIKDYAEKDAHTFFPDNKDLEPLPSTSQRNQWYKQEALQLSEIATNRCIKGHILPEEITHLITVSCTGMYAPGLDIELVEQLGLPKNVERTAINFMGCYAAFNAMKLAKHICNASQANVLVVCTELCSIHFQKEKNEDNLLANALFGDGSAAVLIQSTPSVKASLELKNFKCDLLPSGKDDMAWNIGDTGFEMKLTTYVPDVIRSGIEPLIKKMFDLSEPKKFDYYAVHPGGKKILEVVENALGILKIENSVSHEILRDYGNMSSPTILFVFKKIMDQLMENDHQKNILGIAFGPGLTLESLQAEVHYP